MNQVPQENLQGLQAPQHLDEDAIAPSAGKSDEKTCNSNAPSPTLDPNFWHLLIKTLEVDELQINQNDDAAHLSELRKFLNSKNAENIAKSLPRRLTQREIYTMTLSSQPNLNEVFGFDCAENLAKGISSSDFWKYISILFSGTHIYLLKLMRCNLQDRGYPPQPRSHSVNSTSERDRCVNVLNDAKELITRLQATQEVLAVRIQNLTEVNGTENSEKVPQNIPANA